MKAYLALCGATIALLVFLNSTQAFVLVDVYAAARPGSVSGMLALVDEVTCVLAAPLWGSWSDKRSTRVVAACGMALMAVSLTLYPRAGSIYPGLLLCRVVFAAGAAACVSMMAAVLQQFPQNPGRLAGFAGFSAGVGAVIAVSVLLPLPAWLGLDHDAKAALRSAFGLVALGAGALALLLGITLPGSTRGVHEPEFKLVKAGVAAACQDRGLQLAYAGSAVARAASVVLALFVPLAVSSWFRRNGLCRESESALSDKSGCRNAVIAAAIMTGIGNTAGLFGAPILGWIGDHWGLRRTLAASSLAGTLAAAGFAGLPEMNGSGPIIGCCGLAVTQMGVMTASLALCAEQKRRFPGSVAGAYAFFGSIGILMVTQVGGPLADRWVLAPFVILAVLYLGLGLGSLVSRESTLEANEEIDPLSASPLLRGSVTA